MAIRTFDGNTPLLASSVFVDDYALVTGRVTLEADVSIWPFASLRGDLLSIYIGAGSNIQDNSVLHTTRPRGSLKGYALSIGRYVTVGHGAILHGCTLGDEVLIGMGAIILDGVIIEPHVIVGAGSVVAPGSVLTQGQLYLGTPAKARRALTTAEIASILENAEHYTQLKEQHRFASR